MKFPDIDKADTIPDETLEAEDLDTDIPDDTEDDGAPENDDVDDDDDSVDADDDDVVEDDDVDDADDDDVVEDSKGTVKTPPVVKVKKDAPLFNDKQQRELDRIVQERLSRQEAKLLKDLSLSSGIDVNKTEVQQASKLWGLLRTNRELSNAVDNVINHYLSNGKAKAPDTSLIVASSKQSELDFKEAVLDLKTSDNVFNKNADRVLRWAETEGYDVNDAKSLKLAYAAWKGTQGKVMEAVRKTTEQRKQAQKAVVKKKAAIQGAKPGKAAPTQKDYRKMSDEQILSSTGLSLFTED